VVVAKNKTGQHTRSDQRAGFWPVVEGGRGRHAIDGNRRYFWGAPGGFASGASVINTNSRSKSSALPVVVFA